jgi:signal-transduction protein with cAMP-binding, CBS, and nucleotidyltransferase domain
MNHPTYIKIATVMKTEIRTIDPMSSVSEAMITMGKSGVSSLVIERRDEHDEYGLIVISDIAKEVIAEGRSPDRVNVYEIMTKPTLTLDSEMDIKYGVRHLSRFGVSRGLVLNHDRDLVGIVTLRDMVLAYADVVEGVHV